MRIRPSNWALAALLAGLVVAGEALERPVRVAGEAGPLLALRPEAAARVRIEPPDGADAPGVVLERGDDGAWSLASWDGYPAHAWSVERLLSGLASLSRDDATPVPDAASRSRLGVGAGATRVVVEDASGRVLAALRQGRPDADTIGSFVAPEGAALAARAPRLDPASPDPARWIDPRLAPFEPSAARTLALVHGPATLELARDEDGAWRVTSTGEPAPRLLVERVLQAASSLVVTDLVGVEPLTPTTELEIGLAEPGAPGDAADLVLWLDGARGTVRGRARSWVVALEPMTVDALASSLDALAEALRP